MKQEHISLKRSSTSNCLGSNKIIPSSNFTRSTSSTSTSRSSSTHSEITNKPLVVSSRDHARSSSLALSRVSRTRLSISAFLRSLLHVFAFPASFSSAVPTCRWLTIPGRALSVSSSPTPLGRKVIGTLFGHRKGHVTFAVQDDSRADPALLVELAVSTSALVREMSSGLVRIALECERPTPNTAARGSHAPHNTATRGRHAPHAPPVKLFQEPVWTMYCNGRKCGYATSRACTEFDWHVLSTIQSVSAGAGVIPLVENRTAGSTAGSEGELLYMRAKFERVVGSRDSEAFYMLNPDGNGGPELSIFLLRL